MPVARQKIYTRQDFLDGKCTAEGLPLSGQHQTLAQPVLQPKPEPEVDGVGPEPEEETDGLGGDLEEENKDGE